MSSQALFSSHTSLRLSSCSGVRAAGGAAAGTATAALLLLRRMDARSFFITTSVASALADSIEEGDGEKSEAEESEAEESEAEESEAEEEEDEAGSTVTVSAEEASATESTTTVGSRSFMEQHTDRREQMDSRVRVFMLACGGYYSGLVLDLG